MAGYPRATDRPDARFRETVAEILRLDPGTPARATYAPVTMFTSQAAGSPVSPLTLRQVLTEQGVTVLGLILQPKLIYPDGPQLPAMPVEPDLPTGYRSALSDQAERSAIHIEFRARVAAARICLPRGVLGAALRTLSRERHACLQALRDRIAARRGMQAHERLAREYRRAATLTAHGVPQRPVLEPFEDAAQRIRVAILHDLGG